MLTILGVKFGRPNPKTRTSEDKASKGRPHSEGRDNSEFQFPKSQGCGSQRIQEGTRVDSKGTN